MLIGFEVENFRSIRTPQQLLLTRAQQSDEVEGFPQPEIAPVAAMYGPNAGGKSNFIEALSTAFAFLKPTQRQEGLPYSPFMLDEDSRTKPTRFTINFYFEGVRHEMEFAYDAVRITYERLSSWPKGRERVLYERTPNDESDTYKFGDSLRGGSSALAEATKSESLYISSAGLLRHPTLSPIQEFLSELVGHAGPEEIAQALDFTLQHLLARPDLRDEVVELVRRADLGIESLDVQEAPVIVAEQRERFREVMKVANPELTDSEFEEMVSQKTLHPTFMHLGAAGQPYKMPWVRESIGTRNLLAIAGPVLSKLSRGGLLVIDEIDTSLHPRLVSELVRLFQGPETNPFQAQLILSTHDVTLMMNAGDYDVLSRDQIWFVEKDTEGATQLYPLSDFKPRKGEVFSRHYLQGRYGAVPHLEEGVFGNLFAEPSEKVPSG